MLLYQAVHLTVSFLDERERELALPEEKAPSQHTQAKFPCFISLEACIHDQLGYW